MCRSLLHLENDYIYNSSLRFLFKQLDLYVEHNKIKDISKSKNIDKNTNKNSERIKYKILSDED